MADVRFGDAGSGRGMDAASVASSSSSPSERIKWRRALASSSAADGDDGDATTWIREASGAESFLHYHNVEHHHEHNTHLTAIIKLHDAIKKDDLERRLTDAWTQLFLTFAPLSTTLRSPRDYKETRPSRNDAVNATDTETGSYQQASNTTPSPAWGPLRWLQDRIHACRVSIMTSSLSASFMTWNMMRKAASKRCSGPLKGVTAHYKASATQAELKTWLKDTLGFRELNDVPDSPADVAFDGVDAVRAVMRELTSDFIAQGIDEHSTGSLRLEVVMFKHGYIGLGLRFHHSLYDGTAMYVVLDELLKRLQATASSTVNTTLSYPLKKPLPATHLSQTMPAWVYDSDYSANLRSNMAQTTEVGLSSPMLSMKNVTRKGRSRQFRHHFSIDETSSLLLAAKAQEVTVSQAAALCHLVPLLKRRAASTRPDTTIYYQTTVNVRSTLGLAERSLANAIILPDLSLPASTVLPVGGALNREGILRTAQRHGKELQAQKTNGAWLKSYLEYSLRLLLDGGMRTLPAGRITNLISDGLLERYIRPKYTALAGQIDGLPFDVSFVTLQMSVQSSLLVGRTSTFGGQFMLALDFNDDAYGADTVQTYIDEWAEALRHTLLDTDPNA